MLLGYTSFCPLVLQPISNLKLVFLLILVKGNVVHNFREDCSNNLGPNSLLVQGYLELVKL